MESGSCCCCNAAGRLPWSRSRSRRCSFGGEAGPKRAALPKVLAQHGFGDLAQPVTLELVGSYGDAADVPTSGGKPLPNATRWVFADPKPVWDVLAKATTRRYRDGMFAAAKARLILTQGSGYDRRLSFHYRPGWGSISVKRGNRMGGGDWHFDPAADRALVALLSRTTPTEIGAPVRWTKVARFAGARPPDRPRAALFRTPEAYATFVKAFQPHYEFDKTMMPDKWVELGRDVIVALWLPARSRDDKIDWSNARVRNGVLRWEVRLTRGDEAREGHAPAIFGAFTLLEGVKTVRVVLDGTPVADVPVAQAK